MHDKPVQRSYPKTRYCNTLYEFSPDTRCNEHPNKARWSRAGCALIESHESGYIELQGNRIVPLHISTALWCNDRSQTGLQVGP